MKKIEKIRQVIKDLCLQLDRMDERNRPMIEIPRGASGSAAGLPFEEWFKKVLSESVEYDIFERLEFMRYIYENYLERKNATLNELRKNVWWVTPQQFTKKAIERIKKGEEPKLQQSLGDVVIKYGKDLNDVILINVKATETDNYGEPVGRPPNIISAFRLLKFLSEVFTKKII